MRIPSDVTPGMQQFCREIDTLLTNLQTRNSVLDGRRIINAGDAISPQDYVTLRQFKKQVDAAISGTVISQNTSRATSAGTNYILFGVAGLPAVATSVGFPVQMTVDGTFDSWFMSIVTAGTGSDTQIDIKKNGTSIFSTLPNLSVGFSSATGSSFSTTTFSKGDVLTYDIVAVGVTDPGDGLSFQLNFKAA